MIWIIAILILLVWWFYLRTPQIVISCTDGMTGMNWAHTLSTRFPNKYDITIVLHGKLIHLGLSGNPHESFERKLTSLGVKFVICNLCLQEQIMGIRKITRYTTSTVLDFIEPVRFSIDYLVQRQINGATIIFA